MAALDLLRMHLTPGDVVGIVDGYFHQDRAISHKEILAVMSNGVHVFGSSSLGALRAAELAGYGMRGVGRIFEAYQDQRLLADDEVALAHAEVEHGYAKLSEPLVNIRATLQAAVEAGACSAEAANGIIDAYGQMPYRSRSWQLLASCAQRAGASVEESGHIVNYCREHPIDLKRDDAEALLSAVRDFVPPTAGAPLVTVARTVHLRDWEVSSERAEQGRALAALQVLHRGFARWYQELVYATLQQYCREMCRTSNPDPVSHGVHAGLFGPEATAHTTVLADWTAPEERRLLSSKELTALFLVRSFRIEPGVAPIELTLQALACSKAMAGAQAILPEVERTNQMGATHRDGFEPERISSRQVTEWLSRRWACAGKGLGSLELMALDRGFTSLDRAVTAARQVYLWAECQPSRADALPALPQVPILGQAF